MESKYKYSSEMQSVMTNVSVIVVLHSPIPNLQPYLGARLLVSLMDFGAQPYGLFRTRILEFG